MSRGNDSIGGREEYLGEVSDGTTTSSTSSTTTEFLSSEAYKWFLRNSFTIDLISSVYQVTGAILVLILNGYFVGVMASKKEFRQIAYLPVVMQSAVDFVGNGAMGLCFEVVRMCFYYDWRQGQFYMDGLLGRAVRDMFFDIFAQFLCVYLYFKSVVNIYCTGPCVLVMALDRYILVCHAAMAKQILTPRVRITACSILALITIGPSLLAAYFTFIRRDFGFCFQSFYGNDKTRNRADNTLFFLIPAVISLVLYVRIGLILIKSRAQRSRNRSLTMAFLVSSLLWIVLWLPQIFYVEFGLQGGREEFANKGYVFYIGIKVADGLYYSVSFTNPLIFLFISRSFQQPIKSVYQKIMLKINPNGKTAIPSTTGTSGSRSASSKPSSSRTQ